MRTYSEQLERCLLFAGIAAEELEAVLGCIGAAERSYRRGEAILRAGEPARHMGIVLSGQVQVSRLGADGSRQLMAALGPGGLFGEAYACAGVDALPVTAAASVDDSRVLLLDRARIVTPCSAACPFHQRLISNLMEELAQKNIQLSRNLEHLSKRTLRDKLLSYLDEQAALAGTRTFTIPFDRQELADYLCADRSALSRELGKLQREGVLEASRSRFTLLRREETP